MQWSEVQPILNATYELLDGSDRVSQEGVCEVLGRPPGDERTIKALALLHEDGFIGGIMVAQSPAPVIIQTTPKGLRHTRGWPSEAHNPEQVDLLLRLLDERIASDETTETDKGKLRRARDAIADLGKDIAVGILTAYVTQAAGE
jgi:hypothetical protein